MKTKTIKATLRKKIDDWIASVEDPELIERLRKDTIVTGGAIASMLLREPVNDYDIYFRTRETALAVAQYYVSRFERKEVHGIKVPIFVAEDGDRIKIVVKSAGIASEDSTKEEYQYFENDDDPDAMAAQQYIGEIMQDPGDIEDAYEETEVMALENDKPPYRPVFLSTNAITLAGKIQIVLDHL